ncbi:zinc finger protein Xfin-like [Cydia splendana]|uniref:zinc finger protein Xfin-like n=1 Tax=Cydia splendana TaxID=1100963 RepID=UPI00300C5CA0
MAPPFVACRICRSVEGKLKNYTDNIYLIRAYEEFSGCPFVEWPYMTKFCPECACLIRKVYKLRRKCRKSYKFVVQHLESGRKITKPFIQQSGTSLYHKPTDFATWHSYRIPTIDYVHNPKAYKSKKKSVEEPVFYIKHLTVPKDSAAEVPTVVPEPIYDFNERYYDSSDLEEELGFKSWPKANAIYIPSIIKAKSTYTPSITKANATYTPSITKANATYTPSITKANATYTPSITKTNATYTPSITKTNATYIASINKAQDLDIPEKPVAYEEPPVLPPMIVEPEAPELEAPMIMEPVEDPVTLPEEANVAAMLCKPGLIEEEEIDVKMEDDMIDDVTEGHIEAENEEKLEMKLETDLDPDNLTLLEIKAEMERDDSGKGEKRKRRGKEKEDCRVSKKSQQLQKRARRNQSNQELEEHFTVTQFHTEEEQMQEFLKRKTGDGYLEGKYKCELCLKSFKEQKWMEAHKQKHEPSAGSYVCTICHIRCRTPKLYRTHRDSNHTTRYSCRRCQFFTYSKAQALKHHGWHEGVEHTCQHCGATFRKHTTYMGHLRRAHPSAHICGVCARSFVSAYGLNLHIKAVHKDINKLENDSTRCEECDVTFVSRQMYVRHLLITDRHKEMSKDIILNKLENDSTRCEECDVTFVSRQMYVRHLLITDRDKEMSKDIILNKLENDSARCEECDETFVSRQMYVRHLLITDRHKEMSKDIILNKLENDSARCEECDMTFVSRQMYVRHLLITDRHKEMSKDIILNKLENDSTRCEECDVTFVSRQMYVRHLLITDRHKEMSKDIILNKLENDSARCEECDVTFVSRQMYVRHLLITDRHKEMSKDM